MIIYYLIECSDGDVQLMNSSGPSTDSGRGQVQVCYNNSYWTVCDDRWDSLDAGVVCTQLGFSSQGVLDACLSKLISSHFLLSGSIPYGRNVLGNTLVPILLDNLNCDGSEANLLLCSHNGIMIQNCNQNETAGVHCEGNHY